MMVQDPILIRIMAKWDWKVHLGIFLTAFFSTLIISVLWMGNTGKNPFGDWSTMISAILGSLLNGFGFLFLDLILFFWLWF